MGGADRRLAVGARRELLGRGPRPAQLRAPAARPRRGGARREHRLDGGPREPALHGALLRQQTRGRDAVRVAAPRNGDAGRQGRRVRAVPRGGRHEHRRERAQPAGGRRGPCRRDARAGSRARRAREVDRARHRAGGDRRSRAAGGARRRFYVLAEGDWRRAADLRGDDVRQARNPTLAPPQG